MNVGEICSRDALAMGGEPLAYCAKEMKERNVGSAVIRSLRHRSARSRD
jgi:hypothetical protein